VVQGAADLVPGEDGGEALGPFGRGEEDGVNLFVEDFAVKEEDGTEGLILGGGGDVPLHSQVGQEGLDPSPGSGQRFGGAHLGGVAFAVEEDEAAHPVHAGLFDAVGIMFEPEDLPELVQQFFRQGEFLVKGGGGIAQFLLFGWMMPSL